MTGDEKECMELIIRARTFLKQNRKQGLEFARQAAAMETVPARMRYASVGLLESALRMNGDFEAALKLCEQSMADPELAEIGRSALERSAARCEWRLGDSEKAVLRLRKLVDDLGSNEETENLIAEIERSE